VLFVGQKFPVTERVQSGLSFGDMVRATLASPLFLILLACMAITASLELGPNRWVPAVLEAGGIAGILVLAYINGLMAILRFFAGPVVHRLSPTGILVSSAVLSGAGLYWLSYAETAGMAFAAATVFAVGVCYFWPTMLGVTSERVPKSGALGLALMGGMGMLAVGLVTLPLMGKFADQSLHERLLENPQQSVAALEQVVATYPPLAAVAKQPFKKETEDAVEKVRLVLAAAADGELPAETAGAMRAAVSNAPKGDAADAAVDAVKAVLDPADNYGGRMSFRKVAPFSLLIIIVFGVIYLRDRAAGGYKAESLTADDSSAAEKNVSDTE
ncbi:MAG: hypothetical protein IID33_04935, partial [Planctomycetes bacterium]|nr:hypothetical protein [Planctomycetota bacterium]